MNKTPILFEDVGSDSDVELKTNNDYATHYDKWRQKEELNRLKTKYRDHHTNELSGNDSSSSEDDEDGRELTEEFEKDFFKTLSCLKNKDPKIYDEKVVFFEEKNDQNKPVEKKKSKKYEPMFLKDYERKMILEKGAKFEDSDEEEMNNPRSNSPTYVQEQRNIQESLKEALQEDGNDKEHWGGLFSKRSKTKKDQEEEDVDYKKWLKGAKEQLEDKEEESVLKPLKEYWAKPDLDKTEKFLRDYLLNKRYLEKEDQNHIPSYEEIVHDSDEDLSQDEDQIEQQEEFEHKYNFRFEEPDQDFIKRYPRTLEQSVRKTDDRRKVKRQEIKQRKDEEKKQKQVELKQLKIYKRKEIEEKIKMLKEITGNEEMAFQDVNLEDDFDPEEHDKKMQELFNDQYYQGEEGDQKPEFSDLDEELGPWKDNNEPHCEDDDFNMDADYDPSTSQKQNKKEKKKRNRPGKQSKNKDIDDLPIDKHDERYEEYMDELYKLDCEDMIGDMPCRFKYRDVLPNDFGLSVEEILLAKDKELNRWCSLKKTMQYRPEHMEKYDVLAYKKKAMNDQLKKKLLPSVYDESLLEEDSHETYDENIRQNEIVLSNETDVIDDLATLDNPDEPIEQSESSETVLIKKKNKKKKQKKSDKEDLTISELTNEEVVEKSEITKTNKNKRINSDNGENIEETNTDQNENKTSPDKLSRRQKKNKKKVVSNDSNMESKPQKQNKKRKLSTQEEESAINPKKKRKLNKSKKKRNSKNELKISDERLKAYGINPKKFKNKLKYKNQNNLNGDQ